MRRVLTFLLALVLMFSLCSFLGADPALAADEAEEHEHEWAKATCTEPKTCKICGETEGEAKGHKVEEWKTTVKATCTEEGEKTGVCTRCGETVTKTVKAKGHEPGEKWKTIKKPTSSDRTIVKVKYCERCGAVCKRQERKLSNSEYKSWYKDQCSSISYKKLERNPRKYEGRKIKFTGYVVQVCNEVSGYGYGPYSYNEYRVATKGRYDNVIYVNIYGKLDRRILEGDKITVWGEFDGLMTYSSIFNQSITIPEMTAEYYSRK